MREGADGDSSPSVGERQQVVTARGQSKSRTQNVDDGFPEDATRTQELKRVELAILPSPSREEEDHALRRDHDGDRPRQCQQA